MHVNLSVLDRVCTELLHSRSHSLTASYYVSGNKCFKICIHLLKHSMFRRSRFIGFWGPRAKASSSWVNGAPSYGFFALKLGRFALTLWRLFRADVSRWSDMNMKFCARLKGKHYSFENDSCQLRIIDRAFLLHFHKKIHICILLFSELSRASPS